MLPPSPKVWEGPGAWPEDSGGRTPLEARQENLPKGPSKTRSETVLRKMLIPVDSMEGASAPVGGGGAKTQRALDVRKYRG